MCCDNDDNAEEEDDGNNDNLAITELGYFVRYSSHPLLLETSNTKHSGIGSLPEGYDVRRLSC